LYWFAGWYPFDQGVQPEVKPRRAISTGNVIWEGNGHSLARIVAGADPTAYMVVIGECLATDTELEQELHHNNLNRLLAWPGTYTIVIVSPTETIVVSDLAGKQPIYFMRTATGYWWSSAITPLAAYGRTSVQLANLVAPMVVTNVPFGSDLPFPGIEVVPPGFALRMKGDTAILQKWYEPWPRATFTQTVERLRQTLVDSVERRIARYKVVSSDFSGGLDSTTLALLAAQANQRHRSHLLRPVAAQRRFWLCQRNRRQVPAN
jgi:asparagine synthase (glutamine-hydrolysing)